MKSLQELTDQQARSSWGEDQVDSSEQQLYPFSKGELSQCLS